MKELSVAKLIQQAMPECCCKLPFSAAADGWTKVPTPCKKFKGGDWCDTCYHDSDCHPARKHPKPRP